MARAAQHIEPGHQSRLLEIEGVLEDDQVVAHRGVADAHQLVGLLELVVGLAHLQLQPAQVVGVEVAGLPQPGPGGAHLRCAGEIQQGVAQLQPP